MRRSIYFFLVFLFAARAFSFPIGNAKIAISGGYCLNMGTISTHGFGGSFGLVYGKHEIGTTANAGIGWTKMPHLVVIGPNKYEKMGTIYYWRLSIGAGLFYYYYPFAPIAGMIVVAPGANVGVWYHNDYTRHEKIIIANLFEFYGPRIKVLVGKKPFFWNNEIGFLFNFSKFTPQFRSEVAIRL